MMRQTSPMILLLVIVSLLTMDTGEATPKSPAVMLGKAIHFTAPEGTDDIVVKAGIGIRLTPT